MNSNNNPKAIQTFYDLEIARCNEKWQDILELAKRYKKYHPYESGTALFINKQINKWAKICF
jgi:hypothetical protein